MDTLPVPHDFFLPLPASSLELQVFATHEGRHIEAIDGPRAGQALIPVEHVDTFWFAWTAFHPDTEVVA